METSFKINFDPETDSAYIKIKNGQYEFSEEKWDLILDYDKNNELIWVEILNASKNEKIIKDLLFSWKLQNEFHIN